MTNTGVRVHRRGPVRRDGNAEHENVHRVCPGIADPSIELNLWPYPSPKVILTQQVSLQISKIVTQTRKRTPTCIRDSKSQDHLSLWQINVFSDFTAAFVEQAVSHLQNVVQLAFTMVIGMTMVMVRALWYLLTQTMVITWSDVFVIRTWRSDWFGVAKKPHPTCLGNTLDVPTRRSVSMVVPRASCRAFTRDLLFWLE